MGVGWGGGEQGGGVCVPGTEGEEVEDEDEDEVDPMSAVGWMTSGCRTTIDHGWITPFTQ